VALRARRQRPPDAPLRAARLLVWLACGLNVAFVAGLATVLSDPSEIAFLHYTLVALACAAFLWQAYYWNLLATACAGPDRENGEMAARSLSDGYSTRA
jgi:hypothetical protein